MGARKTEAEKRVTRDARNARKRDKAAIKRAAQGNDIQVLGIDIGHLSVGAQFELDQCLFQIDTIESDQVLASCLEWDPTGSFRVPRWQRQVLFGTFVTPVI